MHRHTQIRQLTFIFSSKMAFLSAISSFFDIRKGADQILP